MNDMKSLERPDYPNADWLFFRDNPERCYFARLATAAEIAQSQKQGLDVATLASGCFVYAVSRLIRDSPPLELQTLFVVLPPPSDMDEADCMAAWRDAVNMGGQVRRQVQ